MSACLNWEEIIQDTLPEIRELGRVGDAYPSSDHPGACEAFTRRVQIAESVLIHGYGLAAKFARRTGSLSEVAAIWRGMSELCGETLGELARLRDKYPYCGTPELYDRVLDYKLACDKRLNAALEEQECLKQPIPEGLFPPMN